MAHVPAALLAEKIAAAAATEAEAPEAEAAAVAPTILPCELEGAAAAHDAVCAGELPPLPLDVATRAAPPSSRWPCSRRAARSRRCSSTCLTRMARVDARRAGRRRSGGRGRLSGPPRGVWRARAGSGCARAGRGGAARGGAVRRGRCRWCATGGTRRASSRAPRSPCRQWAAATDSLGRVLLLEAHPGRAPRVEGAPRRRSAGAAAAAAGWRWRSTPSTRAAELWRVPLGARLTPAPSAPTACCSRRRRRWPPPTASAADHGPCFLCSRVAFSADGGRHTE